MPATVAVATDEIHVRPGQHIQAALDDAVQRSIKTVVVHAGTYAPPEQRQALIWFDRRHDGIHLRAEGQVTLTAANAQIARSGRKSSPAVVNHVVYFGDGISNQTKLSGFTITGANNFVTTKKGPKIQPTSEEPRLAKTAFFYTDGGAIKVFGRSYPILEDLRIVDNFSSPSSGGISIEHRGFTDDRVEIRNCDFRNNRSPLTGAAITLLDHEYGSAALIENCLFVDNRSNCLLDKRSQQLGSWNPESGHGAVTVFAFSRAEFRRCTFVGNRNGVDDLSQASSYHDCIFWNNTAEGGWPTGQPYDIKAANPKSIQGCFLSMNSLSIDPRGNMLEAPDPEFDTQFAPRNSLYESVGFRPADGTSVTVGKNRNSEAKATAGVAMETLQIQVDGEEFGWSIRYPGADRQLGNEDDVETRRHLCVPAGTKVRLNIGSNDYLYQIAFPEQAVKEVAVPGMTHRCSFVVTEPGIYPLVGDQFCGYTHPNLIGKLIVKDPVEFETWLDKQTEP